MNPNPPFWRTLDELAAEPAFLERLHNEFPSEVEAITDPVERRTFLKLMGASLALAGVTACTRQPAEAIVPYVRQPEELIPGRPLFFATAMTLGGVSTGLLVESHEGRPTKVEGNPDHPGSLGAADVYGQAAVLSLYDPDRAKTITNAGEIQPWPAFLAAMRAAVNAQLPFKGAGLRILTESIASPTLAGQINELLVRLPAARWHQWDPASRNNVREGSRLAFGEYVEPQYRFAEADVIVSLDADFLGGGAAPLRYTRDFTVRRRPENGDRMNRLYAVETMPSLTGARADHRLALKPYEIELTARVLAAAVRSEGSLGVGLGLDQDRTAWITAVAKDLLAHKGTGLVIPGDSQPPVVHALAHAMNQALGNAGRTVVYTNAVEAAPVDQLQSIRDLAAEMAAGTVDVLLILGANPVYTAPADLDFAKAMDKVPLRVQLSALEDETSERCHWHIPEAHFLETWSDGRAFDGTASIVQPLIAPLYGGRSAHEVVAAFSDRPERSGHDIVRDYWMRSPQAPAGSVKGTEATPQFEAAWRRWLHDGVIPGTTFTPKTVTARSLDLSSQPMDVPAANDQSLHLAFRLDPAVLDGRFANNGWLQELPKPITKLTWDNAVILSPATAARLKLEGRPAVQGGEHGQIISEVVTLEYQGRRIQGAVFSVPGHPDDCATVHLGYGRSRAGQLGTGTGFNAYQLRTSGAQWSAIGVNVTAAGRRTSLACTQAHHLMEGRNLVRVATRDEYARNPKVIHEVEESLPRTLTLYPEHEYNGYKWGMAIDVNACTGCNACVVGCQSENNIAVIGKEQVLRGREMHWLRVDTYYRGDTGNPETYFQPVPCMQCENAPCEVVCPVGATVHSHEGLNDMVYNRCVGTRYCSNNCPYKVRRFNFLLYQDWNTPSLKLGRNPDVTVRSRGVMEKCTYCVQRINSAKIESEKEDRPVRDGEIKTACQQTCPADAIVFGDLNDPNSRVAKLKAEERNYSLLEGLNTRPRTTYLAALRNPNPELGD
ncbi:MAG TPA: TAT-variant-translocated molybdopterin oxidoreductase [Vicinamibacterales bacterium]|nr:TAT-variant-translocated molybdopterin oxidoreductase [Vicinamibacterales bacterium]